MNYCIIWIDKSLKKILRKKKLMNLNSKMIKSTSSSEQTQQRGIWTKAKLKLREWCTNHNITIRRC